MIKKKNAFYRSQRKSIKLVLQLSLMTVKLLLRPIGLFWKQV